MRFPSVLVGSLLSALTVNAALVARQVSGGTIVAPPTGAALVGGNSFPFQYSDSNECHDGYTSLTVWLVASAPSLTSLNSTGGFSSGNYLYYFGQFLQPNFGLPPLSGSTVPPPTLSLPILAIPTGTQSFFTVVETATDCPPRNQPPRYGVSANAITYV